MIHLFQHFGIGRVHSVRGARRAGTTRRKPALEGLEARELKTIGFSNGAITVHGTDLKDEVEVRYEKGSASSLLDDRDWVTLSNSSGLEEASFAVWKPAGGQIGVRRNIDQVLCYFAGSDDTFTNETGFRSFVNGGEGKDGLNGGSGVDTFYGGAGQDTLVGGAGDDILNGEGDGDLILGGLGSDTIDGGEGYDYLYDYTLNASDEDVDELDGGADGAEMHGGGAISSSTGTSTLTSRTCSRPRPRPGARTMRCGSE